MLLFQNCFFIIFVDDELEHVQSVVACLESEGISCFGFHYTAANEMPCELNPEQARYQAEYFIKHDIWLSDVVIALKINMP